MDPLYGYTVEEIEKLQLDNLYKYINYNEGDSMDRCLSKAIDGFSQYVKQINPDLIIVHGDRVEALAGAIVGSLNNIFVAHIEGGEVSGTIDELIRHLISKLSHIHLVANNKAKNRLIQLGEYETSIFVIGSPDLDLMRDKNLPSLEIVKNYYNINFFRYAIAMFHPVTTEYHEIRDYAKNFVNALLKSKMNYVVIYPNNDLGSKEIIEEFGIFKNNNNIRIYPSIRFQYFLRLLKESQFIIGNSSSGIMEAPFYGIPTIDIGTRQQNRAKLKTIFKCGYNEEEISNKIQEIKNISKSHLLKKVNDSYFGKGQSDKIFLELLKSTKFWKISKQKQFQDIHNFNE